MKTIKIFEITKEMQVIASNRASRIIELEENPTGWCSGTKIYRSKKTYNRKTKHKNNW